MKLCFIILILVTALNQCCSKKTWSKKSAHLKPKVLESTKETTFTVNDISTILNNLSTPVTNQTDVTNLTECLNNFVTQDDNLQYLDANLTNVTQPENNYSSPNIITDQDKNDSMATVKVSGVLVYAPQEYEPFLGFERNLLRRFQKFVFSIFSQLDDTPIPVDNTYGQDSANLSNIKRRDIGDALTNIKNVVVDTSKMIIKKTKDAAKTVEDKVKKIVSRNASLFNDSDSFTNEEYETVPNQDSTVSTLNISISETDKVNVNEINDISSLDQLTVNTSSAIRKDQSTQTVQEQISDQTSNSPPNKIFRRSIDKHTKYFFGESTTTNDGTGFVTTIKTQDLVSPEDNTSIIPKLELKNHKCKQKRHCRHKHKTKISRDIATETITMQSTIVSSKDTFFNYNKWLWQHLQAAKYGTLKANSSEELIKAHHFLLNSGGTEKSATDASETLKKEFNTFNKPETYKSALEVHDLGKTVSVRLIFPVKRHRRIKRNLETGKSEKIENEVTQSPDTMTKPENTSTATKNKNADKKWKRQNSESTTIATTASTAESTTHEVTTTKETATTTKGTETTSKETTPTGTMTTSNVTTTSNGTTLNYTTTTTPSTTVTFVPRTDFSPRRKGAPQRQYLLIVTLPSVVVSNGSVSNRTQKEINTAMENSFASNTTIPIDISHTNTSITNLTDDSAISTEPEEKFSQINKSATSFYYIKPNNHVNMLEIKQGGTPKDFLKPKHSVIKQLDINSESSVNNSIIINATETYDVENISYYNNTTTTHISGNLNINEQTKETFQDEIKQINQEYVSLNFTSFKESIEDLHNQENVTTQEPQRKYQIINDGNGIYSVETTNTFIHKFYEPEADLSISEKHPNTFLKIHEDNHNRVKRSKKRLRKNKFNITRKNKGSNVIFNNYDYDSSDKEVSLPTMTMPSTKEPEIPTSISTKKTERTSQSSTTETSETQTTPEVSTETITTENGSLIKIVTTETEILTQTTFQDETTTTTESDKIFKSPLTFKTIATTTKRSQFTETLDTLLTTVDDYIGTETSVPTQHSEEKNATKILRHRKYIIEKEYNDGGGLPTRPLIIFVTVPTFIGMGLLLLACCFLTRVGGWCCHLFDEPKRAYIGTHSSPKKPASPSPSKRRNITYTKA